MPAVNHNDHPHAGREATSRRLRVQLAIFTLVFLAVTALAVERIIRDGIDPFWPLAGFAVGLIIGTILGRSKALGWNAATHEVVSSLSVGAVVVTILYLIFMLLRDRILSSVVDDATTVAVIGLTITGGVMLGRVLVTVRDIRRVLTGAGIVRTQR